MTTRKFPFQHGRQLGRQLERRWRRWSRMFHRREHVRVRGPDVHWMDLTVRPLAALLGRELFPNREIEVLGPQGLCARCWVEFRSPRTGWVSSFQIEPCGGVWYLRLSEEWDSDDTAHRFPAGSIGELNGMNRRMLVVPDDADPAWFLRHMTVWRPDRVRG